MSKSLAEESHIICGQFLRRRRQLYRKKINKRNKSSKIIVNFFAINFLMRPKKYKNKIKELSWEQFFLQIKFTIKTLSNSKALFFRLGLSISNGSLIFFLYQLLKILWISLRKSGKFNYPSPSPSKGNSGRSFLQFLWQI